MKLILTKEGAKQIVTVTAPLFGITQQTEITIPFEKLKKLNLTLKSVEFDGEHFVLDVEKSGESLYPAKGITRIEESKTCYYIVSSKGWRRWVGKELVAEVFKMLLQTEEATVKQIKDTLGASEEQIRNALRVLVHQGKVRFRREGPLKIYFVSFSMRVKHLTHKSPDRPSVETKESPKLEGLKYAREARMKAAREGF